jgi:hypothetical protein
MSVVATEMLLAAIANPHQGKFRVKVSRYLANASYTGNSAKAWYLLAEPSDLPVIEVAFLNGHLMERSSRAGRRLLRHQSVSSLWPIQSRRPHGDGNTRPHRSISSPGQRGTASAPGWPRPLGQCTDSVKLPAPSVSGLRYWPQHPFCRSIASSSSRRVASPSSAFQTGRQGRNTGVVSIALAQPSRRCSYA